MNDAARGARERVDYDVVVVGAGPAGLAAAIHLKQIAPELTVVVVEKGSEVGAHILSGAVIDPSGIDALLPGAWDADGPVPTAVTGDKFYFLTERYALRLPNFAMPPLMSNHGCRVGSLGRLVRWLGEKAEALGVEIYPGFAAAEVLYDEAGAVIGVATGDMGVGREGELKAGFARGMELCGKYTLFAEGTRGFLTQQVVDRFKLDAGRSPQKYGIGLKELWQLPPGRVTPGVVQHSFGWPLDDSTGGGSFVYHLEGDRVAVGFVVHLDYRNPTLSPFDEFQRFKHHPLIAPLLRGGERIGYGARAITEGGWQSVPKLSFPGGALIGDGAGLLNVPRIKGSHNAVRSGMDAAKRVAAAIAAGRARDEITEIETEWRSGAVGRDLWPVRNVKPLWSRLGLFIGVSLGGFDMWSNTFGFSLFGTLKHKAPDNAVLNRLDEVTPIAYPKPDGRLSFDRTSSVYLSNISHEEDQPVHLRLKDAAVPIAHNLPLYGEPARLYCPAGVYEVVYADDATKSEPRFVINAQNCVHCKTCDIKDPTQNIVWTAPEGGAGPNYPEM